MKVLWLHAGIESSFCVAPFFLVFEVLVESIGSTLKRFAKSLSIARLVESTILRSAGLTGYNGGGEDGFLELCWADFLGAGKSFHFTTAIRSGDRGVLSWGKVLRH